MNEMAICAGEVRGENWEDIKNCFSPEDTPMYPLCKGNGDEKCQQCNLYVDLDDGRYE